MANFDIAYKRTSEFEGGYVKDHDDNGGETYKGIARNSNPNWSGWKIIDSYKKQSHFPKNLENNNQLQLLVKDCYRIKYWNAINGDKINNQNVANDLYDSAVNMGVVMSIKLSQKQFKLPETGKFDNILLKKLNSVRV